VVGPSRGSRSPWWARPRSADLRGAAACGPRSRRRPALPAQPRLSRRWLLTLAPSRGRARCGRLAARFLRGPAGLALGPSTSPSRFPGAPSTGKPGKSGTSGSGRTPLWSFPAGGQVQSDLAVANGVFTRAPTPTGSTRWTRSPARDCGPTRQQQVQTGPVVYDGMVYAADMDGTLYALDAATGARRWHFSVGPPGVSEPVPGHGLIFLAGEMNALYCWRPAPAPCTTRSHRVRPQPGPGRRRRLLYTGDNPGGRPGVPPGRDPGVAYAGNHAGPAAADGRDGGVVYVPDTGVPCTPWTPPPARPAGPLRRPGDRGTARGVEAPPAASRGMSPWSAYLPLRVPGQRRPLRLELTWAATARPGPRPATACSIWPASPSAASGGVRARPRAGRQVWSYTGELGVVEVRHRRGGGRVYVGTYREHPRAARVALAGRSGRHGAGRWRASVAVSMCREFGKVLYVLSHPGQLTRPARPRNSSCRRRAGFRSRAAVHSPGKPRASGCPGPARGCSPHPAVRNGMKSRSSMPSGSPPVSLTLTLMACWPRSTLTSTRRQDVAPDRVVTRLISTGGACAHPPERSWLRVLVAG